MSYLDPLLLEQLQAALGVRRDRRQLVGRVGALRALLLLADARRHRRLVLLLLLPLALVPAAAPAAGASGAALLVPHLEPLLVGLGP